MARDRLSIGVVGAAGRLGRLIVAEILDRPDCALAFAAVREGGAEDGRDVGRMIGRADLGLDATASLAPPSGTDVVVDVSTPQGTARAAAACAAAGVAFVTGVTGLDAAARRAVEEAATRVPVLHARNFSVAVAILAALVHRAAAALNQYDIEIIESHHRWKADAPSGTARLLGEAAACARGEPAPVYDADRNGPRAAGGVGFAVTRGGGVVGEHAVRFDGLHDGLILEHRARDRRLFAEGALEAARRLVNRPAGHYTMADLFDIDMK